MENGTLLKEKTWKLPQFCVQQPIFSSTKEYDNASKEQPTVLRNDQERIQQKQSKSKTKN